MPKLSSQVPRYRRHKASGQAVVRLAGHDFYLGKYGTAASREAYRRFTATWLQNGALRSSTIAGATVTEIIVRYVKFATGYYRKQGSPTDELRMIKSALKVVRQLYGGCEATTFGPLCLKACREQMIANGWCRTHINRQIGRVKRAFKWAVENELIPGSVAESLRCVAGLKRGRSEARESHRVLPVPEADLAATIQCLPPVVCDMVRLQRLCGARPSEICDLRPIDINRCVNPWEYRPQSHKCEHHDHERVIFFGPRGQAILDKYLERPDVEHCFSPAESDRLRRAAQHIARKTSLSCGNRPGSNVSPKPKRPPGKKYDRNSYARAVRRAAKKAGVATWSPNRLRHSFATEVRRSNGLEACQVLLGHASADVSQLYAERDFTLAARIAQEIG